MRRLLGCLLVTSWLFGCGGSDEQSLFQGAGGASGSGGAGHAGTPKTDAGQHAGSNSVTGGGSGTDSGVVADVSVSSEAGPDVGGSAGSGGAAGADAADVSIVPSDASDAGRDASEAGGPDSASVDGANADAKTCNTAGDCPTPTNVCMEAICDASYLCGVHPVNDGWPIPTQTAGDCKRVECDGAGATKTVNYDSDVPSDDNSCTTDGCSGGSPTHTPVNVGTVCTGGYCNGAGNCVQCLSPSNCGTATDCSTPTCVDGVCGVTYAAVDTPIPTQIAGDCKIKVCDGTGGTKQNNDDGDKPNDSNVCTDDTCTSGVPVHTPLTGHLCGASGVCSDQGACVGCNNAGDCGTNDFCKAYTCVDNVCGLNLTTPGTKLPDNQQTTKDCKKKVCDNSGNIQTVEDPTDPPIDTNDCTVDQCSGSTPQNVFADPGVVCSSGVCDGAGACVQCLSPANCAPTGNVCTQPACDGTHHCVPENKPPDTTCGAGPSCNALVGHLQDKCSSGACVPGSDVPCSPYACGASACKPDCSVDGDCVGGTTCDTGVSVCTNGPKCTEYCSDVMSACTGSYLQYFDTNACLKSCKTLPRGTLGDSSNSVGCRITHAGYAVTGPATHCGHAGPGGDGACGANCEGFCTIALGTCTGGNQVWATMDACMVDCGTFPATPAYNASITSGNSFACRMYHLTAAAAIDPVFHCPHIRAGSLSATCYP